MSAPVLEAASPVLTGQQTRVSANASKWRLRSLVAMGHSVSAQALALGIKRQMVSDIIHGDLHTITATTERRITALWEAWWCRVPPTDTLAQQRAFTATRTRAAVNDWPCPAALDEDELEEPGYRPPASAHWRAATGCGVARDRYPLGRWP